MAMSVFAARYDNPKPTPHFHTRVWDFCCSDYKYVAIAAPRGHAKTTSVTGSYLMSNIIFRQHKYILVLSDTESQAADFLGEIKNEFTLNQTLRDLTGFLKFERDTTTDIILFFANGFRCRVIAKGSEQKLRGMLWYGTRPSLVIGDDLENEELVSSDTRREKFKKWFYGSVLPMGSDDCVYRIAGTILHFDSLLESLMPDEESDEVFKDELSEWKYPQSNQKGWASIKFKAHDDDFSHILWPEKFSRERLESIQMDYMRQGLPDVYSQEYLNVPITDDAAYFKEKDFHPLSEIEEHASWYVGVDLAITKNDRSAYTVFAVCCLTTEGRIQVRDIRRGRWDSMEIIDELFDIHATYKPDVVWFETENIQKSLGPVIEREMRQRGQYVNIELVTPTKDKIQRARPLQARMRAGGVEFTKEADWYFNLEKEMRQFDKGPYKDQVDALGLVAHGINEMSTPRSDWEVAEDEYNQEFGAIKFGRSRVSGY